MGEKKAKRWTGDVTMRIRPCATAKSKRFKAKVLLLHKTIVGEVRCSGSWVYYGLVDLHAATPA